MNIFKKLNELFLKLRDNRAEKIAKDYTDILKLQKMGIIRAKATGQTITDINAQIKSRVRIKIKVLIPHGTYFVSRGSYQNMVTRKEYQFELYPMDSKYINVPASCINAGLPIPTDKDNFKGVARVSKNLEKFLVAATNEDAMTIQAGVWAITDNYSAYQIQQHLRITRSSAYGSSSSSTESAVSDYNIKRAREILKELNITTNL